MKFIFIFLFSLFTSSFFSQVKTLIPADEEVNLPVIDSGLVGLITSFDETQLDKKSIVSVFVKHIKNTVNPEFYHILDTGKRHIELFIVYPCSNFNISKIYSHQIINEGIITSSLFIRFNDETYDIDLKNFEWINRNKKRVSIDKLYRDYQKNSDITFRLKYYGILKSSEYSIAETLSNLTAIIDEIVKEKSGLDSEAK